MNISTIKENVNKYLGKKVRVKEYLGRNKYDTYDAILSNMYSNTFLLYKDGFAKSFTYSDVLIKNIILK